MARAAASQPACWERELNKARVCHTDWVACLLQHVVYLLLLLLLLLQRKEVDLPCQLPS